LQDNAIFIIIVSVLAKLRDILPQIKYNQITQKMPTKKDDVEKHVLRAPARSLLRLYFMAIFNFNNQPFLKDVQICLSQMYTERKEREAIFLYLQKIWQEERQRIVSTSAQYANAFNHALHKHFSAIFLQL